MHKQMETRIGITGALDEEIKFLKKVIRPYKITKKAGLNFYTGFLTDKRIVLVKSGVGKINASFCAQILIDCFNVNAIVNIGTAGAVRQELRIGDLIISTKTAQHDFDTTAFGYKLGEIYGLKKIYFRADNRLVNMVKKISKDIKFSPIGRHYPKVYKGLVVSGDKFITKKEEIKNILKNFKSVYCTDMESTAVGQVCYFNKIPFIAIKTISDQADKKAKADFSSFIKVTSENLQKLILELVKNMPTRICACGKALEGAKV